MIDDLPIDYLLRSSTKLRRRMSSPAKWQKYYLAVGGVQIVPALYRLNGNISLLFNVGGRSNQNTEDGSRIRHSIQSLSKVPAKSRRHFEVSVEQAYGPTLG